MTHVPRFLVAGLLASLLLAFAGGAYASQDLVLEVDHRTGLAKLKRGADDLQDSIRSGSKIEIKPSDNLVVHVKNTNTASFDFKITADTLSVPNVKTLQAFGAAFKPYLAGVLRSAVEKTTVEGEPPVDGDDVLTLCAGSPNAGSVRASLKNVNVILSTGPNSLQHLSFVAMKYAQLIRGRFDKSVKSNGDQFRQLFGGQLSGSGPDARLNAIDQLITRYDEAEVALRDYRSWLLNLPGPCSDISEVDKLVASAHNTLEDAGKTVVAAYALEEAFVRIGTASNIWTSQGKPPEEVDLGQLTSTRGVRLNLSIAGTKNSFLQPTASGRKNFQYEIKVLPRWAVSLVAGVSFLYSPRSTFPKFSTRPTEAGDSVAVVLAGSDDRRFEFLVNFGVVPWFLNWKNKSGLYVVPFEFSLNPSDKVRSLALGGAVGWRALKLGGGWLWSKHTELDRQEVGVVLKFKDDLNTTNTYGSGTGYISLSIVGWPPFMN